MSYQFTIPIQNQHSYKSILRNKDLKLKINNHCNAPSTQLVVDWTGECFVCSCEAWLPISVGNISDFTDLNQVWVSPSAKLLQQDIDSGEFTHCAVDRCGVLDKSVHQQDYYLSINIDESCNLRCPSCRPSAVMLSSGSDFDRKLAQVNHLVDMLEKFEHPIHIVMSGNGDPLASHIMRPLIHRFVPKKNQTIRLFTNGLLLEKQLTDSPIINNITQYFISIDAGSAEVYEQVRLGGTFTQLIKNFDYLRTLCDQTKSEVLLKFVLQKDNYNDMQNFVDLCYRYQFRGVINRLEDWGTWSNYTEHDVIGNVDHELHAVTVNNLLAIYKQHVDVPDSTINFNPSLIALCKERIQ